MTLEELQKENGETHELPDFLLESANKVPNSMSDYVPFWITGWRDLHDSLHHPANKEISQP